MDVMLRLENPDDYHIVENVTREAFWNQYSPGCSEHYLMHIMRSSPAFVAELDFVAVYDSAVVGNIAYVRSAVEADDDTHHEVLCLGPISVLPEFQSQGIGGKLIEHTKQLAQKMGSSAIFLYGDPAYYSRHSFVPAESLNIRTADNKYAAALQVCVLNEQALTNAGGRFVEDAVYKVDEAAAAEFDKSFPHKEKLSGTPSQKRFEKLAATKDLS